jgi:nicotinamidase-related amidase
MVTALLLVDVINEFFDPRGRNYHPSYDQILRNIGEVLALARLHRMPVVHCREGHRPGHDFEHRKLPVHDIVGSFDAQPAPGFEVGDEEMLVQKRRFSAFFATDLDLLLRERNVDRLVVVGVKSHVCIRATIEDAFAYGYEVFLIRECTGSNHSHLNEATLEDIERYMGSVISLEKAKRLLFPADAAGGPGAPADRAV